MFRVSRDTFDWLCDELRPRLHTPNSRFRESINVEKKVAIGLHFLSKECKSMRDLSKTFAVGAFASAACALPGCDNDPKCLM